MSNQTDKCIALSALFMAAEQIDQIAYHGVGNSHDIATLVGGLLENDAKNNESVFGGRANLRNGFSRTIEMLSNRAQEQNGLEIMRYVISLINLEGQLGKNTEMGETVISTLDEIKLQTEQANDVLDADALEKIGELYQNTISQLGPRILIKGEQQYLESPLIVAKVRSLLLAGIRAAVLWRQSGGNRLTLLLSRKALLNEAQRLLATI